MIMVEAIPGQDLEPVTRMSYEADPKSFEAAVIDLVREHAPPIHDRIDRDEFAVIRPLDVVQGAITPTVRKGYAPMGNGKFAMALGDVHVVNDPILAQGANNASRCAWILGEALLDEHRFDETFCQEMEDRLWQASRAATQWNNMMLQQPPPHVFELFATAARSRTVGDAIADLFDDPDRAWEVFSDAVNAAEFINEHQSAYALV
jgi:hypothetical protein